MGKVQKKSLRMIQGAGVMFIREKHKLQIWMESLRSYLIAVYKYFYGEKKPVT